MVKFYPSITEDHTDFISAQPLFYIASAPLAGSHINISPKGHPSRSFAVLDPNTVAYLDATGSGCETISHVYENGRVTVMFCSFGKAPQIMRLFCKGEVIERMNTKFEELRARMGTENGCDIDISGARAIILLHVWKVQTSCGFGVPLIGNDQEKSEEKSGTEDVGGEEDDSSKSQSRFSSRDTMDVWAEKMLAKNRLLDYQKTMNYSSLDGLPGLQSARRAQGQAIVVEDCKAWVRRMARQWDAVLVGLLMGVFLMFALYVAGQAKARSISHIDI